MRVVLIRLFRLKCLLHIACIQMQSRVQCFLSNGLGEKLLNYKDVRESICVGGDVFLSVPEDSDLGKSLTLDRGTQRQFSENDLFGRRFEI